ncbi:helix-turn-helix domain-containing protein [Micromonospora sp. WMMD812]|uniref:winged helix-turn-helix transcriptional regulator n=1 Tax=Micromonospora sp. WMMD812 TaxID=3015152 RepID=UPI00248B1A96|nr:helix-turn-helix domain-containing protein [Micromonospora sp. WMMD812]WBB65539.1 helix-turn-helix domain-containing protein [Micromonospora sp. WMMD812]
MRKHAALDPAYPACSIARSLEILGERWTFLILREALGGTTRFTDFGTRLGVSTDILTDRLATLVRAGILEKRPYQEIGERPRSSYHPTPAGAELLVVLGALQQWGDRNCPPAGGPASQRRSRATGQRLSVAYVDESGQAVPLEDVTFVADAQRTAAAVPSRPSQP